MLGKFSPPKNSLQLLEPMNRISVLPRTKNTEYPAGVPLVFFLFLENKHTPEPENGDFQHIEISFSWGPF